MKEQHNETAFATIASDELADVTGGAHKATSGGGWNLFGWLDGAYKNVVYKVAGNIGGNKLAEKMYGSHVSSRDRARSQAAMKQFLVAGGKLPKGVPNLFG